MAKAKREFNYTFHIDQEALQGIEILCPLSIKQETYLNDNENDIVVWGGAMAAGKTQLSLIRLMLAGMWDKDYVAGIARQSQKQMKMAGSLWSTGCKLFAPYGISSNKIETSWTFPSGAEVKCHHLFNNIEDWHGTQCTEFLVDESQQCQEEDVWFLTSRMRSKSKQKHQLRLTCNPLNTSFLCEWLVKAGYVGEDGYSIKEMDGVSTYMIQLAGEFRWYKTYEELLAEVGKETAAMALKFVYYNANVYDNPYIRKHLPQYVHKLENQKPIEKARNLHGNWFIKSEGDGYIDRNWFKEVGLREIPLNTPRIRCYDLASTKPHEGNKDPDWTRGIKATYCKDSGYFYILDMVSMRDSPAMVQGLIETTAQQDGRECYISIPVDAGASGRVVADQKKARLTVLGHKVVLDSTRKGKLARAEPFLIALQEGKVFVAPNVFTKEHYYEMEAFDGKNCSGQHDDIVDSIASCYNMLTSGSLIPTIRMNTQSNQFKRLGGTTLL
jgi:predicted phage terminase large subunit-like protein